MRMREKSAYTKGGTSTPRGTGLMGNKVTRAQQGRVTPVATRFMIFLLPNSIQVDSFMSQHGRGTDYKNLDKCTVFQNHIKRACD